MKMKAKAKRWIGGLCAIVLIIGAVTLIGNFSNGFENLNPKDWEVQKVNEDNLIKVENYTIDEGLYQPGTGVTVDVDKNGTFIVDGKHGGSEDLNVEIGTVELEAGTYTFKSGYKNAGLYTAYLKLVTADGYKTADFGEPVEISANTTAKIVLVISPDVEFNNARFAPTLASGSEAIDFFE